MSRKVYTTVLRNVLLLADCGLPAIAVLGWLQREEAKNSDVISIRKGVGNIACACAAQWAEMDLFFQNKISHPGIDRFGRFFFLNTGNKK